MSLGEKDWATTEYYNFMQSHEKVKNEIQTVHLLAKQVRETKVDCLKKSKDIFSHVENSVKQFSNRFQYWSTFSPKKMDESLKNAQEDLLSAFLTSPKSTQKAVEEVSKAILENQKNLNSKSDFVQSHLGDFRKLISREALEDVENKIGNIIAFSKDLEDAQEYNSVLLNNLIDSKIFLTIEEDVKFYENLHNDKISEKMNKAQEILLKGLLSHVERFTPKEDRTKLALFILLSQNESQFVKRHSEFFKSWIQL